MFAGKGLPVYMREVAIAHALELALAQIRKGRFEERGIKRIEISAGDEVTCSRMHSWLPRGAWRL